MEGRDLHSLTNIYVFRQHKYCSSAIGTLPSHHTSLSTYGAANRQIFSLLPHVQHHTSLSHAAAALGQNILPLSRLFPPSTLTRPVLHPQTHIPRRCSNAAAPTLPPPPPPPLHSSGGRCGVERVGGARKSGGWQRHRWIGMCAGRGELK